MCQKYVKKGYMEMGDEFTLSPEKVYVQGSRAQFLESYMNNSNDFAVYCHKFFCLCA